MDKKPGRVSATASDPEAYIGKILFFPRGRTFFQVEGVKRYTQEEMGGAVFLQVVEVNNPQQMNEFEPEEIGEELFLVPPDFSKEKIQSYQVLAAQREATNEAMHDIAMGIVNYQHYVETYEQFPFQANQPHIEEAVQYSKSKEK